MSLYSNDYWKCHEKPCPYAEGNRCFIAAEPSDDSCKGCKWYEWHEHHKTESEKINDNR